MAFFKTTKSQKEEEFPETLSGFGYEFSEDGKIRNSETGEGFQFVVREGDQTFNQKHYEALGEVVTNEVYNLLETECKLKRAPVPHNATDKNKSSFIFLSDDALSNPDKLMVLIHGSGIVRAGQWSRKLIINDSLKSGSQIPFIKEAMKEGYGIIVTNTNDNHRAGKGKIKGPRRRLHQWTGSLRQMFTGPETLNRKIMGSENPESHALHVWKHYIHDAKAKHIAIIAHSYGGCVVTALYTQVKKEFIKKVFGVAMTDSVHYLPDPKPFSDLVKVAKNWVCSQDPLDTPVKTRSGDIPRVSAGVTVHEETSWASFSSIFKFLQERLKAVKGEAEEDVNVEGKEEKKSSKSTSEEDSREDDGEEQQKEGRVRQEEEEKEVKKMKMDADQESGE